MKTEFLERFSKDIDRLPSKLLKRKIEKIILKVERSSRSSEISNLKKLKGHDKAYRIRIGDYRIGVFIENEIVEFARVAHRKEIYRIFP